jgi:hypothetical protein
MKNKSPKKDPWTGFSFDLICEFLGIAKRTLYEWLQDGLPRNPDKTFNLKAVHAWIMAKHDSSETTLKALKLQEEIERLKRLNANESGQMVNRQEMEDILVSRATTLRNFIERSLAMNRPQRAMKSIEELAAVEYELTKQMMTAYVGSFKK